MTKLSAAIAAAIRVKGAKTAFSAKNTFQKLASSAPFAATTCPASSIITPYLAFDKDKEILYNTI
jgi:hypothetical protein